MNYQLAIAEEEDYLRDLERNTKHHKTRDRIRFLRFLKSGRATTQEQAGELIGLRQRQSQRLWALYRREGLAAYLENRCRGYAGQLTPAQQAQLEEHLRGDEVDSLKGTCAYVEREFGVRYSVSGVSWRFRRYGIKLKTGRPHNPKQKAEEVEAFKKNASLGEAV